MGMPGTHKGYHYNSIVIEEVHDAYTVSFLGIHGCVDWLTRKCCSVATTIMEAHGMVNYGWYGGALGALWRLAWCIPAVQISCYTHGTLDRYWRYSIDMQRIEQAHPFQALSRLVTLSKRYEINQLRS